MLQVSKTFFGHDRNHVFVHHTLEESVEAIQEPFGKLPGRVPPVGHGRNGAPCPLLCDMVHRGALASDSSGALEQGSCRKFRDILKNRLASKTIFGYDLHYGYLRKHVPEGVGNLSRESLGSSPEEWPRWATAAAMEPCASPASPPL